MVLARRHMWSIVPVISAALLLVMVAGSGSGAAQKGQLALNNESTTLTTAYYIDPGSIDPDVFYGVEGDSLLLSVYNTLVTYAPGTTRIIPDLATSWTISPDGKTYTFYLRRGVKFHDGTAFNAQAVKINFERRIELKQAVSYMVANITSMDTPTPYTFVVHLKQRNNAFLNYMASMYGPKIVSPTGLRIHAGKNHAMSWLSSHEDGSGPYELVAYRPGDEYVLERFNKYWGPKPYFSRIVIDVVPDISTAELEVRSGGLDLLTHGVPESALQQMKSVGLNVRAFPAAIRQVILLNPSKPPFNDQVVRQTFAAVIERSETTAISAVDGPYATPARSAYPQAMSDNDRIAPLPTYPKRTLAHSTPITLSYDSAEPDLLELAQYFQEALDKVGFRVTLKGDTVSQEFGYISDPKAAPNAVLSTYNPDAAALDTWARPVWYTNGGLNLLDASDKTLDTLIDDAATAPTQSESDHLYSEAGERASQDAYVIQVDDVEDVVVSNSSVCGLQHVPVYIWAVNFATLRRC